MGSKEDIEQDVLEFLSKVDHLSDRDRRELLMNMFRKHLTLNQSEFKFIYTDLSNIISMAKDEISKISLPMKLGKNELIYSEVNHFAMVLACIQFLNSKDALKKMITY